eukprot:526331-Pleurochrysis_carterae.AAC.1
MSRPRRCPETPCPRYPCCAHLHCLHKGLRPPVRCHAPLPPVSGGALCVACAPRRLCLGP